MLQALETLPPGISGLAPELADKKHGSAAGSVPRTSDDAAQGASRRASPLGLETIINDAAPPDSKRRAVSRELPAPPPGVILQELEDSTAAAGERSLDLSSDVDMNWMHDLRMFSYLRLRKLQSRACTNISNRGTSIESL